MPSQAKIFLHQKFIADNNIDAATLSDALKQKIEKFNSTLAKTKAIDNAGKRMAAYRELDSLSNILQEDIEDEVKALQAQAEETQKAAEAERIRLEGESKNIPPAVVDEPAKKKGGSGWGLFFGGVLLAAAAVVGIKLSQDGKKK